MLCGSFILPCSLISMWPSYSCWFWQCITWQAGVHLASYVSFLRWWSLSHGIPSVANASHPVTCVLHKHGSEMEFIRKLLASKLLIPRFHRVHSEVPKDKYQILTVSSGLVLSHWSLVPIMIPLHKYPFQLLCWHEQCNSPYALPGLG